MRLIENVGTMRRPGPDEDAIAGLRVIVAEDDWLVSLALQDILTDLGCDVAGAASEAEAAMTLAQDAQADVAILDYWLHDRSVEAIADALIVKGIPIILATGFGATDISPRLRHLPLLRKPYLAEDVEEALAQFIAPPAGLSPGRDWSSGQLAG